ncbi:CaiB/BaiF CoA transferase family protein [Streptomyces sp. NPDC020330]|uniref:CaiB/BaiF CoA transferase family protein n=1 Tax=unclassified Streptomyces TaxID=2593676 RepID=UPI003793AA77
MLKSDHDDSGARGGPLHGLTVLELGGIGPAPFACMNLADLGAEVLRVDRPGVPRPFADWHRVLHRGRRSVALDLKHPAAAPVALRLVEHCDVLVEGYRPGVAERLGLGPDECRARNPRLVYARMTGWGGGGPLATTAGHDINYLALSGALDLLGPPGGPPTPPANLLGDFAGGGLGLVCGILAALHERGSSGTGQVVEAAIVDGTASLLGMVLAMRESGAWPGGRGENLLDGGAPFYTVYPCSDGGHIAVGALEDPFYAALLHGLGLRPAELPDRWDRAHWPRLREVIGACFARRPRDRWAEDFAGTDACVTPVLSLSEAPHHPQHRARGTYVADGTGTAPAPTPRFARTPGRLPHPAPAPGADTREVLARAGLDEAEIAALLDAGAAGLDRPEDRPGGAQRSSSSPRPERRTLRRAAGPAGNP